MKKKKKDKDVSKSRGEVGGKCCFNFIGHNLLLSTKLLKVLRSEMMALLGTQTSELPKKK